LPPHEATRQFTEAGGLLSYGQDYSALMAVVAAYVDRILKGAKVRDLPFQEADRLEFGLNLKTARTLGLSIPREIAARANFVIE
jgi:putative ABC transport system substrate-binding protein